MEQNKTSFFEKLFKKIKQHTIFWLMDTPFWFNLLKYTVPFIRLTTYYPHMKRFVFQTLYRKLQAGDILFQIDDQKLTAKVIGGEWSHVGICVDKGEGKVEVVDMTHEDFRQTDFFQFCAESSRVAIGRVVDERWTPEYNEQFIQNVWEEKDSKYNFAFRAKEKVDPRKQGPTTKNGGKVYKFNYCSQLPMAADTADIIDANWEDLAGLGVPYISPTGLFHAKNIQIIADSNDLVGF